MSTLAAIRASRARVGKSPRGWPLAGPWPALLRRLRLDSCPVCHGRVRPDDALGLVDRSVAHAECALVTWLGPGRLSRELL